MSSESLDSGFRMCLWKVEVKNEEGRLALLEEWNSVDERDGRSGKRVLWNWKASGRFLCP